MSALETIQSATDQKGAAKVAYEEAKAEFQKVEQAYMKLIGGDPQSNIKALVSAYAKPLATFIGLPGLAAGVAQPGVLDALLGVVERIFGG